MLACAGTICLALLLCFIVFSGTLQALAEDAFMVALTELTAELVFRGSLRGLQPLDRLPSLVGTALAITGIILNHLAVRGTGKKQRVHEEGHIDLAADDRNGQEAPVWAGTSVLAAFGGCIELDWGYSRTGAAYDVLCHNYQLDFTSADMSIRRPTLGTRRASLLHPHKGTPALFVGRLSIAHALLVQVRHRPRARRSLSLFGPAADISARSPAGTSGRAARAR